MATNRDALYTRDSSGNVTGLVGPDGKVRGTNGFIPPTNDYAGITSAINAAVAAGGGIVQLLPVTYVLTQAVQLQNGVKIVGSGWVNAFQSNTTPTSGTLIQISGSGFNAFEAKRTALGSWDGLNSFLKYSGVSNLAIIGAFNNGVQIGNTNSSGPYVCNFENLYIRNCTQWGIWVENSETCFVTNVNIENCANGIYWGQSIAAWNGGDSVFNFVGTNLNSLTSRHIYMATRNGASQVNGMRIYQCGGLGAYINSYYTETMTVVSTNANIPVADLSRYAVGMPVVWSATAAPTGFYSKLLYFIQSMSGTSGAGTVRLAAKDLTDITTNINSSPAITPTSGGSFTLQNKGFPGIECVGVTGSGLYECYTENTGTAMVYFQDCQGVSFFNGNFQSADNAAFPYSNHFWAVGIRNSGGLNITNFIGGMNIDSDSVFAWNGYGATSPQQVGSGLGGVGIRNNGTYGGIWLNTKASADIVPVGNGYGNLRTSGNWKFDDIWFNGNFTFNPSTSYQGQACVVFYGTTAGTLTMPSGLGRFDCNLIWTLTNVSTQNCTLQVPTGQYIVRAGVRTASGGTTVILPNTSVTISVIYDNTVPAVIYAVSGV